MRPKAAECVHEVLDVIPLVMRSMRSEFRSHRGNDLSIPQYRTLTFIRRSPGVSLSDVADHLGITLPSTSKLVSGMVDRGLIDRQESPLDRRKITLMLTSAGSKLVETSYRETQAAYVERFSDLTDETLATITEAMQDLRLIFTNEPLPYQNQPILQGQELS